LKNLSFSHKRQAVSRKNSSLPLILSDFIPSDPQGGAAECKNKAERFLHRAECPEYMQKNRCALFLHSGFMKLFDLLNFITWL